MRAEPACASSPAQRGRGTAEGGGGGCGAATVQDEGLNETIAIDEPDPDAPRPERRAEPRPLHHASHGSPPALRRGGYALHATAVAISGRALLIRGPSRSGKSRLALALVAASTRHRPIRLIGDDRVLLTYARAGLVAHAHPRIAGFIERRGLGIVAMPYVAKAAVAAIVSLGEDTTTSRLDGENFPLLRIVKETEMGDRADHVLSWWDHEQTATCAQHSRGKAD